MRLWAMVGAVALLGGCGGTGEIGSTQAATSLPTLGSAMLARPHVGDAAAQSVDSALAGQRAIVLPGSLAGVLRSRAKVRVDQDALQSVLRTVATEWRVKHANDSTATSAGTPRPPAPQ